MKLAIARQIQGEKERIIGLFASNPLIEVKAVTKVTKSILLNSPYIIHGSLYDIKAKSLGAGVYKLTAKVIRNGH